MVYTLNYNGTHANANPAREEDSGLDLHLSDAHRKTLTEESGIAPQIFEERGYRTATKRSELPDAFRDYQRRPGLLIPVRSPSGKESCRLRPDRPRRGKDGKPRKYEQPAGMPNMIDVHPRNVAALRDSSVDLWAVEGEKKADSLASRGLCSVALFGVWGFCVKGTHGRELLPDWDHVALDGRRVYIVFDADVMVKENVQLALGRLVAALEERGAEVRAVYLPGPEKGVDDFLAGGGTVSGLKLLARKFVPQDLGRIRLSRDDKLRKAVEYLWSRWWDCAWSRMVGTGERPNSMRGHSCRDVEKVAIDQAAKSGEVVEDGVKFTLSTRTWALRAATSKPTILKSIAHLEAEGRLRRDYGGRAKDAAGAYVLLTARANLYQYGERPGARGKVSQGCGSYDPGGKDLRAPRLRWSAPTFDRDGDELARGYVHRLGKIVGAIVDVLDKEGPMDINELADALNRRGRDLRRRNLPSLEGAGVVTVEGDKVRLAPDWFEALERERLLKGENDAEERDRTRYQLQREAYRRRHETAPDRHPANVGADGYVEDLQPADVEPEERPPEPEVSGLARAIRGYLDGNPRDAAQPPGWIGVTLWCYDLCDGKPSPSEVRDALHELGGEAYLRSKLRAADGRAA